MLLSVLSVKWYTMQNATVSPYRPNFTNAGDLGVVLLGGYDLCSGRGLQNADGGLLKTNAPSRKADVLSALVKPPKLNEGEGNTKGPSSFHWAP